MTASGPSVFARPASAARRLLASTFIREIVETYATRIALLAVGIVATMITARILGPEGRGLFAAALALGGMGTRFGDFGLYASNTYYVSRNRKLLPLLLGNSLLVSFGFIGPVALLVGGAFVLWPWLAPVHGAMLSLALVWIPLNLAYLLIQNLLIGVQEVRAYNRIEISSRILGVAFVGVVILLGRVSPESIFLVGLVTMIVALVWSAWKLGPHCERRPTVSLDLLRDNVRYSMGAYAANVFSSMVLRVDLLMVQYMRGPEQTGYYSVASTMAELIYMLPTVVGTLLFPRLSALPDPQEKWRLTVSTAWSVAAVMCPLAAVAVIFAKPIVSIVFGEAFLPAVPAFVWLMPGIFLLSVGSILQNYIGATGDGRGMIYGPLVAAVTNVIANFYLIERFGIVGSAYASSVSYGLLALIAWGISRRGLSGGRKPHSSPFLEAR